MNKDPVKYRMTGGFLNLTVTVELWTCLHFVVLCYPDLGELSKPNVIYTLDGFKIS